MRPSNVSAAFRRISKSSRSPCLNGRTLFLRMSPTYAAAHWSMSETPSTTKGLSKMPIIGLPLFCAPRTVLDIEGSAKSSWTEVQSKPANCFGQLLQTTTSRADLRSIQLEHACLLWVNSRHVQHKRQCTHRLRLISIQRAQEWSSHSGTTSPEPPNSLGKSFSFGSPSRIGQTVSA